MDSVRGRTSLLLTDTSPLAKGGKFPRARGRRVGVDCLPVLVLDEVWPLYHKQNLDHPMEVRCCDTVRHDEAGEHTLRFPLDPKGRNPGCGFWCGGLPSSTAASNTWCEA